MVQGSARQRWVETHLSNPIVRLALRLGIAPKAFALLETTGRRSGLPRLTPIGNGLVGSTFWLVALHGTEADYMKNAIADPRVRVKVRRRWYAGVASLLEDGDGLERRRQLDRSNGMFGRLDGVVFRAAATDPVVVRIDLEAPGPATLSSG